MSIKGMKVRDLIDFLKGFDADLPVARGIYSEQELLTQEMIGVEELCYPRKDGWVQNKRPDMKSIKYLVIQGN